MSTLKEYIFHILMLEEDLREWQDRAEDFWKDIDANKYLAPNGLRHLIEDYIKAMKNGTTI